MELVCLPDERLHQVSLDIADIDQNFHDFCMQMVDTMHHAKGVGLAGVQVGLMKRVFVTHADDDIARVFINPKITHFSDSLDFYEEGCLSIPGVYAQIQRPTGLRIEAYNLDGKAFELEIDGFLARVIQHEYDHLEGRLFYEHLPERKQSKFLQNYARLHQLAL